MLLGLETAVADKCRLAGGLVSAVDIWRMSLELPEVLLEVAQLVLIFARTQSKAVTTSGCFDAVLGSWRRQFQSGKIPDKDGCSVADASLAASEAPGALFPGGERGGAAAGGERHALLMEALLQLLSLMYPHMTADRYAPVIQLVPGSLQRLAEDGSSRALGFLLQLLAKMAHDPLLARELFRLGVHESALSILDFHLAPPNVQLRRAVAAAWSSIVSGANTESGRRVMSVAPRSLVVDAGAAAPAHGRHPSMGPMSDAGVLVLSANATAEALCRLPEALPPELSHAVLDAASPQLAVDDAPSAPASESLAAQEQADSYVAAQDVEIGRPGQGGEPFTEPSLPALASTVALKRHLTGMLSGRTPHGVPGNQAGSRTVYPPVAGAAVEGTGILRFHAEFEEANLRHVVALSSFEYEVQLAADLRNPAHCQWFCWSMSGMLPGMYYTFHIVNLTKPSSLFEEGAQPFVLSRRLMEEQGIAWRRMGTDVAYYANGAVLNHGRPAYSISFSLIFPCMDDDVLVSHFWMYTLSDLRRDIARWTDPASRSIFQRALPTANCQADASEGDAAQVPAQLATPFFKPERYRLMQTPGGHFIDVFRVGPRGTSKPIALVAARAHPGETPASWMMRGVCDFLLLDHSIEAARCRERLTWMLVPMLNPDGVVAGNTRTNLAGVDLNRHHHDDSGVETVGLRALFSSLRSEGAMSGECPLAFADLHGHSRRRGIFMMGNVGGSSRLPRLLAKATRLFDLKGSAHYALSPTGKDAGVGRVAGAARGCPHSFTLEASFGMLHDRDVQLAPADLQELGRALCLAICGLTDPEEPAVSGDEPSLALGGQEDDDG